MRSVWQRPHGVVKLNIEHLGARKPDLLLCNSTVADHLPCPLAGLLDLQGPIEFQPASITRTYKPQEDDAASAYPCLAESCSSFSCELYSVVDAHTNIIETITN